MGGMGARVATGWLCRDARVHGARQIGDGPPQALPLRSAAA